MEKNKNEYMKELEGVINKDNIKYNEPMKNHTTAKVGGPADVLILPSSIDDILNILIISKKYSIPVITIGNGSKLIVTDKGIRGIVIKLSSRFSDYNIEDEYVTVCSGMSMPRLSRILMKEGLSGLEFACGIPGVIGGGVMMNAGAYGGEMADVVVETTYIDDALEIKKISNAEHNFAYRYSIFKEHPSYVIIQTKLKLVKSNVEEIQKKMENNNNSRKEKQPLEYPNAGSTFKRPEGFFVGTMIQDLGLKGYSIGGAEVSKKHAGFIVNKGDATAEDFIKLIEYIKGKVFEKYKVKLENEVQIIGEK